MDDPFASIIFECMIPPEAEEALRHAPEVVEPCFSSVIRSLNDRKSPAIPNSDTAASEIHLHPESPSSPRDKESLCAIPAREGSSSFPDRLVPLDDFTALIKYFSQNSDRSLACRDILEIAESKGLFFPPPKWWRPGGYDKVKVFFFAFSLPVQFIVALGDLNDVPCLQVP